MNMTASQAFVTNCAVDLISLLVLWSTQTKAEPSPLRGMKIETCWFCSAKVHPGRGICFVRNDAKAFVFCGSKCHSNFKLRRNPRKVRWTKAHRQLAGKDLASDSTFELERRRNRPPKYNRQVLRTTLHAMKRIQDVRNRRQMALHRLRKRGQAEQKARESERELRQNATLVSATSAQQLSSAASSTSKSKAKQRRSQTPMEVDQQSA